jgi:hypothetical protein
VITIEFITKFPKTTRKHDSIIIVVDKLTKDAHFVRVKTTLTTTNIAEIYMRRFLGCMGYLGQLSHTEMHSLLQIYGMDYLKDLVKI